jgi:hypothetical protein
MQTEVPDQPAALFVTPQPSFSSSNHTETFPHTAVFEKGLVHTAMLPSNCQNEINCRRKQFLPRYSSISSLRYAAYSCMQSKLTSMSLLIGVEQDDNGKLGETWGQWCLCSVWLNWLLLRLCRDVALTNILLVGPSGIRMTFTSLMNM